MECNRDEAKRAKEIAEEKFSTKDITGAKKFALKAQKLYPGLDGISQFLAILDVYVAAENKIDGEIDFYGILGLNPLADEDTIKKHYKKLALSLHPDKNKSIGAEGAFQFVSQAITILSDKEKRSIYDQKRIPRQNGGFRAPKPPTHNGSHNFTKSNVTSTKAKNPPKGATTKTETPPTETGPVGVRSSIKEESETFWTVCKRCKLQHEYMREYLNLNLLCPTCQGPFRATETAPPNNYVSSETCTSTQWGPFPKFNGGTKKRDREEVHKGDEGSRRKIPKSSKQEDNKRGSTEVSIRNQLIKIATMEIRKKVNEWSSEAAKDAELVNGSQEPVVMDVPDPEFHDFDSGRSEDCFKQGQVWAVYDDHDGMPRLYAIINKVISVNPFKIYVCWLNPKPGMKRVFGEFKPGKHEIVSAPNYFSHRANFTKQTSGNIIRVFPRKGGVCALYRNDETYEIVEVDAYDEETGTVVTTPLVKVSGFKSVFHRHLDPKETRVISEKEISHEIPACLLTGQENARAPKGCLELDPAAVPAEFLQVKGHNKLVEDDGV